jgi:predicted anti-sigma-YlaC factor YlaD
MSWSLSAILLLVAVVLFLLAAFKVDLGSLDLVTLGFAAFAGSFLVAGWKR